MQFPLFQRSLACISAFVSYRREALHISARQVAVPGKEDFTIRILILYNNPVNGSELFRPGNHQYDEIRGALSKTGY